MITIAGCTLPGGVPPVWFSVSTSGAVRILASVCLEVFSVVCVLSFRHWEWRAVQVFYVQRGFLWYW